MFRLARRFFIVAWLAVTTPALAAEPRRTLTQHDFVQQSVEFNRKTLVDAYRDVGKRDPRWDDAAIKFLDALAVTWGNQPHHRMYVQQNVATSEQLVQLGEAAVKAGCDDPMVRYALGRKIQDSGPSERAHKLVRDGQAELMTSKYPAHRKRAALTAVRGLEEDAEARKKLDAQLADLLLESLKGPIINDAHRRLLLDEVQEQLRELGPDAAAYYDRVIKQEGADPWVVAMLAGEYHIDEAWRARGSGFANTVTEEGWKGFRDNLKLAEESYMKAVRAQPHLPDAFTMMITVSMGKSDGRHRAWFDKAVAAQLDYLDAYNRVYGAMLPRWGGSYVEMLEVGISAARTGRFDTLAPLQFISAVSRVTNDNQRGGGKWDVWSNPETYKIAADVFTQYAEKLRPDQGSGWYRAYHAAVAWRIGKYDEARRQLDLAGENAELAAFGNVDAPGDLASSQIYGLTGPQAADYTKAIELYDARQMEQAHNLFKDLLAKLPADDKGQLYLRDRVFYLDAARNFAMGKQVDLMPTTGRLSGWKPDLGTWWMEKEGTILGESDNRGLAMFYDINFGRRYEITAKVEVLTPRTTRWANAGIYLGFVSWTDHYGVFPDIWGGGTAIKVGPKLQGNPMPLEKVNTIHATLWDSKLTVTVNGKPLNIMGPLPEEFQRHSGAGVGTYLYRQPGQRMRVHEFKIRKLDKEPAPAE